MNRIAAALIVIGLVLIFTIGKKTPAELEAAPTPEATAATPEATPEAILNFSTAANYQLVEVAQGLDQPLYAAGAFDGSNRLFIVTRLGKIWILDGSELLATPFLDVSALLSDDARTEAEVGLHNIVFDPHYRQNGEFYIMYEGKQRISTLARYQVSSTDPNRADPDSAHILLTAPQPFESHTAAQLAFGPDGYLYIGFGDGGAKQELPDPLNMGQRTDDLYGSILRIDVDQPDAEPYAIPPTNPFVGKAGFAPEIWLYGFRNPSRFSFDRKTGDLYIGEVGETLWEEIDFQPARDPGGENYGWAYYEGPQKIAHGFIPHTYAIPITEPQAVVWPALAYQHTHGRCAVTGGYVYRGTDLPALNGIYLYADFCSGDVYAAHLTAGSILHDDGILFTTHALIPAFAEDERGEIYVVNYLGSLMKIVAGSQPAATAETTATPGSTARE